MTFGGNVAEPFIRCTVHNEIDGIKNEGKLIKNTKNIPQTKVQEMQIGAMQLMVLIVVFREHPSQVCKDAHAPELIRRPVHTFVSSES